MKVSMPSGSTHGWGIAGSYLKTELSKLPQLEGVTLHCITGHDFRPFDQAAWDRINIGYCFFEHELLAAPFIAEAAERWDHIVAGSSWCEQQLRKGGMVRTSTILQGVDQDLFHQQPSRSGDGRFIVFSGGKFEYRKGQDLVIAAMKTFMERHPDVWLSCSWHNHWPQSLMTMEQSRLIDFTWRAAPCHLLLLETVCRNGLDPNRVLLHPPFANSRMPLIYAESDIGLFPNRCEGGNNLVMCEYMASGRTVIASDRTGQADVVTAENAWPLTSYRPVAALTGGVQTGAWHEAVVEELLEALEEAYHNQAARQRKACAAVAAMQQLTWAAAARRFYELGQQLSAAEGQRCMTVLATMDHPDTVAADLLLEQGNLAAAELAYRRLLLDYPLHPALLNSLGTVLAKQGDHLEAAAQYRKALNRAPGFTAARFHLATCLIGLDSYKEAVDQLEQVVQTEPAWWQAWYSLATACRSCSNRQQAQQYYGQVLVYQPDHAETLAALGDLCAEEQRFDEALQWYDRLLRINPENLTVLNAKGLLLHELEHLDEASACFEQVLEKDAHHAVALNNLGNVCKSALNLDQALDCYDRALQYDPDNATIRFNRSLVFLMRGDCLAGWPDYEQRFNMIPPVVLPHPELPRWHGESLSDRCLLVQGEQVYGDTFMFVRYLPLLSYYGGRIVFECQDRTIRPALQGLAGCVASVVVRDEPLPPVDLKVPLLSLPGLLGTTLETIPFAQGYLTPDPQLVARWGTHLTAVPGVMQVGLVWGGRKAPLNRDRSMQLHDLQPLFEMADVRFISLQLGEDATQVAAFSGQLIDIGGQIRDFGDTAALLVQLDLLITVDTAIAHLAGALGVPVWVLLKYAPDWRWLLERPDSPWYRSAVLFRQPHRGSGWGPVVQAVQKKLAMVLANRKKTAKVGDESCR